MIFWPCFFFILLVLLWGYSKLRQEEQEDGDNPKDGRYGCLFFLAVLALLKYIFL